MHNTDVLAAVNTGGATKLMTLERPRVGADSALLRVESAGVCGSDIAAYSDGVRSNYIMGHENSGVIEEIGPAAAERWGVQTGDRVLLEEYLPCLNCEWCHAGEYRLCFSTDHRQNPTSVRFGRTTIDKPPALWGGFSQYLYLPPNSIVHRLSSKVGPGHAPLALPIANGIQWCLYDGRAGPGSTVVVLGPGQQGLGCVIAAVWTGARVVVAGLPADEPRLAAARGLGAELTVDVGNDSIRELVNDFTQGRGADTVVDTSSRAVGTAQLALDLLKRKGGVVMLQGGGPSSIPDFPLALMASKYATLKVTRGHSYRAVDAALSIIESGRFNLDLIATDVIGLPDIHDGLRRGLADRSSIHVTVDPWLG